MEDRFSPKQKLICQKCERICRNVACRDEYGDWNVGEPSLKMPLEIIIKLITAIKGEQIYHVTPH